MPGADVPTRISYLTEYLAHELALSSAAPPGTSAAQSFLESTYAPLANAAWAWSGSYGFTDEGAPDMEDYIAAQIDAMRSYDASLGWSGDRIGFAWAPSNGLGESTSDYATDEASILSELAASIDASADPSAPGAGACAGALVYRGRSRRRLRPRLECVFDLDADDARLRVRPP